MGTLAAFEKTTLSAFLKDLGSDRSRLLVLAMKEQRLRTISHLERKRHAGVKNNLKSSMTNSNSVQSKSIEDSEQEMIDIKVKCSRAACCKHKKFIESLRHLR